MYCPFEKKKKPQILGILQQIQLIIDHQCTKTHYSIGFIT